MNFMELDYMENMTVSMKWSFIPWNESAKKSSNSMELSAFHRKKNMHYVDPSHDFFIMPLTMIHYGQI